MKKIFHCADVHIGAASKFIPDLLDEQIKVFDKFSTEAEAGKVSAIVIAGDLFDSPHVSNNIINAVRDVVTRHKNVNYIAISGTHGHDSYENEISIYKRNIFNSFPENFHLLDRAEKGFAVVDDIAFYSPAHTLKSQPAASHHVLLFHGTADGLQVFLNGSAVKRFNYIAMGHYHYYNDFKLAGDKIGLRAEIVGNVPVTANGRQVKSSTELEFAGSVNISVGSNVRLDVWAGGRSIAGDNDIIAEMIKTYGAVEKLERQTEVYYSG